METGQAFEISILASGSTGNSLYLETTEKKILVDAGLSGKKIESLMQQVGNDLNGLYLIAGVYRDAGKVDKTKEVYK